MYHLKLKDLNSVWRIGLFLVGVVCLVAVRILEMAQSIVGQIRKLTRSIRNTAAVEFWIICMAVLPERDEPDFRRPRRWTRERIARAGARILAAASITLLLFGLLHSHEFLAFSIAGGAIVCAILASLFKEALKGLFQALIG